MDPIYILASYYIFIVSRPLSIASMTVFGVELHSICFNSAHWFVLVSKNGRSSLGAVPIARRAHISVILPYINLAVYYHYGACFPRN